MKTGTMDKINERNINTYVLIFGEIQSYKMAEFERFMLFWVSRRDSGVSSISAYYTETIKVGLFLL